MKMNVHTVGWLVFLALIKDFSGHTVILFKLEDRNLKAKEGSCIEINCSVSTVVDDDGAYWFWMKNAHWHNDLKKHDATIVYSTNNSFRPVSPDFANRVKYTGSESSNWKQNLKEPKKCNILICELNKADSGNYSFRFIRKSPETKWVTNTVNLTVEENPCLITFEKPPVITESGTMTLTCSTLSTCPSNPKIEGLTQRTLTSLQKPQERVDQKKSTTVSFTATWQDDGKVFSCQTEDNEDPYLIRNISVTVEYAPNGIQAKISPENVMEGQSVTVNCFAKGNPEPTFTWFKNDSQRQLAEWNLSMSIASSQSGEYYCEAQNKHGTLKSNPVILDVTYVPQVEVKMTSPASAVQQGDQITLTCNIKRSNPQPHTYEWLKDFIPIFWEQKYVIKSIEPEHRGSYTCSATNSVGIGTSEPLTIDVKYGPRKTSISIEGYKKEVLQKVNSPLTLNCGTDANPIPNTYSWHRYNENQPINSSHWMYKTTEKSQLHLESIQRADEACYICNATNAINTGPDSESLCIQVLYPPTIPMLSMDDDVMEGQLMNIHCTVESFPHSSLTLTRTSASNPQSSEELFTQPSDYSHRNILHYTFNVTSAHTGFYTCAATNSEGSKKSTNRMLVVKYRPINVTVQAEPGLVVNEAMQLTLRCIAQSRPPVTSVTWMIHGKSTNILTRNLFLRSVSPSDSGLYSCEAHNEIGTGKSQPAEVKVKYAPKYTNITKTAEQHLPNGKSSVTLSCISHSYPPIKRYTWYKKIEAKDEYQTVTQSQNYTVLSDEPGEYYCIAENEIDQSKSDPVQLFVDDALMKILRIIFLFLLTLLFICSVFLVCRLKRNKSIQQGTMNTLPCFGFQVWWNGALRRNLMNEPIIVEPFRSRDDLLQDQPSRPKAQRRQPHPDNTPASNISSVYCTVNLPAGKQGPPAQNPIRQQVGHTEAASLHYAAIHFGNKQKNKQAKAEEDVVYAMVSKQKPPKKNEQEMREDYENISPPHAATFPNPLIYDTDTSEDEVDLNYSQVNFKANPGHQRASRDSSTSDETTQYSEVKI